jgi:uncharacterized protein
MEHRPSAHLTPQMKELLASQELVFISTADRDGACHASFQQGAPGFVRVLDDSTLIYPVREPDAVLAGGEDRCESRRVVLLCADLFESGLALHVDGRMRMIEHAAVEAFAPLLRRVAGMERFADVVDDRVPAPARWALVDVVTARIERHARVPRPAAATPAPGPRPPATTPAVDDDELSYLLPPAWQPA